jgi:hypothetical protein
MRLKPCVHQRALRDDEGHEMLMERSTMWTVVKGIAGSDRLILTAVSLLWLLAPTPGAAAEPAACGHSLEPRVIVQLLFGRGKGDDGGITQADWGGFVAHELTPRFPDGFTVIDASGQWLNPQQGAIIKEDSKVVEIVLPSDSYDAAKTDAVINAYKRQFRVLSVGLIVQTACVRF